MNGRRWLTIGVGLIALDVIEDRRRGITLSQATRQAFRTHHPIGRAIFIGAWAALTAWLIPHICPIIRAVADELAD